MVSTQAFTFCSMFTKKWMTQQSVPVNVVNWRVPRRVRAEALTDAAVQCRVPRQAECFAFLECVRRDSVTQFRRSGFVSLSHIEGGSRGLIEGSARMFFDRVPIFQSQDRPTLFRALEQHFDH